MRRFFIIVLYVFMTFQFCLADMYVVIYQKDGKRQKHIATEIDSLDILEVIYNYVDMGLSVKWATTNVGANSPEEYGDYYGWGEIEAYPTNVYSGTPAVLPLTQDVANIKWGNGWRMPTVEEVEELIENTVWVWTTLNGINGAEITSNINGNKIFLPAAGNNGSNDVAIDPSYGGNYWTRSYHDYNGNGYNFWFNSSGVTWGNSKQDTWTGAGLSIRPVMP